MAQKFATETCLITEYLVWIHYWYGSGIRIGLFIFSLSYGPFGFCLESGIFDSGWDGKKRRVVVPFEPVVVEKTLQPINCQRRTMENFFKNNVRMVFKYHSNEYCMTNINKNVTLELLNLPGLFVGLEFIFLNESDLHKLPSDDTRFEMKLFWLYRLI